MGGEQLAGAGFAFDVDESKMGRGATDAGEELLHDEAAAHHGAEHPSLRLNGVGLKGLEVEALGGLEFGFLCCRRLGKIHGTFPSC